MLEWKENPVNDSYETNTIGLNLTLESEKLTIKKGDSIIKTLEIEEPMPLYDERELIFFDNGEKVIDLFLPNDHGMDFNLVSEAIEEYVKNNF